MDSDSYRSFGFAFNNVRFSDRLLRIEITNDGEITNGGEIQDHKRRRTDVNTRGLFLFNPKLFKFFVVTKILVGLVVLFDPSCHGLKPLLIQNCYSLNQNF